MKAPEPLVFCVHAAVIIWAGTCGLFPAARHKAAQKKGRPGAKAAQMCNTAKAALLCGAALTAPCCPR